MDCVILRFDAPLMSFGAVVVDHVNPTWRFPSTSMLAGLFGNALGWEHRDSSLLQSLQDRLRFAARWDAEPEPLSDYQTVDLGQDFMVATGWTTRGRREDRKGGTASTGTHQRWRDFWANGVLTIAAALDGEGIPTLEELAAALQRPARPLFLGRKPCLPAGPIYLGTRHANGVRTALSDEQLANVSPRRRPDRMQAIWPLDEGDGSEAQERFDLRDWSRNLHSGSQRYVHGFMGVSP